MIRLYQVALFMFDLHRRRVLERRVFGRHVPCAARQQTTQRNRQSGRRENNPLHGITSRPTAKFIWLAALRKDPTRFR